jgi:hypothetical protein
MKTVTEERLVKVVSDAAADPQPTEGLQAIQQWQPMDSAPRDRSRIIVGWGVSGHCTPWVTVGRYENCAWRSEHGYAFAGEPDAWQPLPPLPSLEPAAASAAPIALVTNGTPLTVEMMCEALKRTRRTYDEHPISEGRGVLELLADHLRQLSSEAK